MSRRFLWCLAVFLTFFAVSCQKEKKPIDPLSYIMLTQQMENNHVIEHSRTQLIGISPSKTKEGVSSLTIAFSMDSHIPKGASPSPQKAYAIRFSLQDSLFRSKQMGGGTFVLRLQKTSAGYSVNNFRKTATGATRSPEFVVNSMDTLVNPGIVDVQDTKTKTSILLGSKGTLTPLKPRTYSMTVFFRNVAGDEWAVDHGYLNETSTVILNTTNSGLKIDFPFAQREMSKPDYDLSKLGTI